MVEGLGFRVQGLELRVVEVVRSNYWGCGSGLKADGAQGFGLWAERLREVGAELRAC